MNLLTTLFWLAVVGLIVGGLARLLTPGRDTLGIGGTILAGLAGSFIGGLIATYLLGSTNPWVNFAIAVGAAVLFVLPFRLYYAQPVVVERPGFFGSRSVDPAYDPAYDGGFGRRPFWSRRRRLY
jgi:uncharacterized membrane protein YeaQ/YmgE (transglycosylase-associated protein family)